MKKPRKVMVLHLLPPRDTHGGAAVSRKVYCNTARKHWVTSVDSIFEMRFDADHPVRLCLRCAKAHANKEEIGMILLKMSPQ